MSSSRITQPSRSPRTKVRLFFNLLFGVLYFSKNKEKGLKFGRIERWVSSTRLTIGNSFIRLNKISEAAFKQPLLLDWKNQSEKSVHLFRNYQVRHPLSNK